MRATDHTALLLVLLVLGVMMSLRSQAAEPLVLEQDAPLHALAPHTDYWCDQGTEAGLEQARDQTFTPVPGAHIGFGYRPDACWFRFELHNASHLRQDVMILVDYGLLDQVDLYQVDDHGIQHWSAGDQRPMDDRPLQIRSWTFPVSLDALDRDDFYLRIQTTSSMTVPLTVSGVDAFIEYRVNNDWLVGVFYGVGLGLVLYHLVLWVRARESIYRFYVVHVIGAVSYLACLQGFAQHLWPDWLPQWDDFPYVVGYLSMISAMLFARDYLGTSSSPRLDRWLMLTAWSLFGGMLVQLLTPSGIGVRAMGLLAAHGIIALFVTGLISWARGHKQARIFVLAWGLFLSMVGVLVLNTYGVLGRVPVLLTLHGMHIGVVVQQVLLSFGLAARLNDLKNQALAREQESIRARAENASKSEFLARMSHEIRTPMNAVLGLTQLMQDTRLDHEQSRYINTIASAGNNLLEVINDILDYSKIEAGKLQLEDQPFDLPRLLNECMTMFVVAAEQDQVHMFSELSDDLPEWVSGDSGRLRQVLVNLLGNAVKFTDHGSVFLRARLASRTGHLVRLMFEVEDTGIGIEPTRLDNLFQPFSQADGSMSRRYGGTGLGLAICRQLVEMMGGEIEAKSEPGHGATFRFSVLMGLVDKVAPEQAPPDAGEHGELEVGRVLVVEDNPVNQMVIRAMLDKLGVESELATHGAAALSRLEEDPACADLVLMDCEMPGMDGYETTRRIRRLETQLARPRMPIIALTAHALPEHRQRSRDAGMDDHLPKPLTLDQLADVLRRWSPPRSAEKA